MLENRHQDLERTAKQLIIAQGIEVGDDPRSYGDIARSLGLIANITDSAVSESSHTNAEVSYNNVND